MLQINNLHTYYGNIKALRGVTFHVEEGEILALIGENGAGKSTVIKTISGAIEADSGEIIKDGSPVRIASPKDAYDLGIGMVHQHFKLIDVFTAMENILLGLPSEKDEKSSREEVQAILDRYGFELNLDKKVYDMLVSEKETLEIVKTLYRGADILILDEPQRMGDAKSATQKALEQFKPLFVINYSATHKIQHNLVNIYLL